MNPEELPPKARRAFEDYPQIEPSPAFNRAVLESLAAAQTRRRASLIGRVEELLGLKWWQFAASGLLGALVPAVILGALLLNNRGAAPSSTSTPNSPAAIGPLYARGLWRLRENGAPVKSSPLPPARLAPASGEGKQSCLASKFPLV